MLDQQWCDISEVIESDFLISVGDIYLNRKVQLEDADIKESTKAAFELLCEQQQEAFSKKNKDIGHTQLIEMEIDTGDSLPVAQSPYTLPLKHYDWVRQKINLELSKEVYPDGHCQSLSFRRNQHLTSHQEEDFVSIIKR